jgi:hypothetical protein
MISKATRGHGTFETLGTLPLFYAAVFLRFEHHSHVNEHASNDTDQSYTVAWSILCINVSAIHSCQSPPPVEWC